MCTDMPMSWFTIVVVAVIMQVIMAVVCKNCRYIN